MKARPRLVLLFLTALLAGAAAAPTRAEDGMGAAARAFDPRSLDLETIKASTLESLIDERLKKVIEASGVHSKDFSATATVHVVKTVVKPAPKLEAGPVRRPERKNATAATGMDAPSPDFQAGFGMHSMLDADDLISQFESMKADSDPSGDSGFQAGARTDGSGPSADSYEYLVDSVYLQAALSDSIYDQAHAQVEKALHESFDSVIPGRLRIDVNQFSKEDTPTLTKVLRWLRDFKLIVMEALLLFGLSLLLLLSRMVPSWQGRQALKTAHEQKEKTVRSEPDEDATAAEGKSEEAAPAVESPMANLPPALPALPNEEASLSARDLASIHQEILSFAASHPGVGERVVAAWIKEQEPVAKISYFINLLARNGHGVGQIELRDDQLSALREYTRKGQEPDPDEQLRISKEAFWDLISSEHFKLKPKPDPFQFASFVDDRTLLKALRSESLDVQARIIGSLGEKRAASLVTKYPSEEKRKIMEIFFFRSEGDGNGLDLEPIASRLQEKLKQLTASRVSDLAGAEAARPILSSLDFASQFSVASSLLNLEAQARNAVLRSYFNVALLPLARPSFLEKVFVDRDTNFVKTILSQYESSFVKVVQSLLPPMQQRMLEGAAFSGVPRGQAMTALKELNDSISKKIHAGELAFEDIFDLDSGSDSSSPDLKAVA